MFIFMGGSRSECKFGIRNGTDYNEWATNSFNEIHPPKSTPMTKSNITPLNSPKTTSNNPTPKSVVLHLYKNGTISLGKAGEILGLSKQEMLHLLGIRRIPINYTTDDLNSDLETLDRVIGEPPSQTHHNHATRNQHPRIVPQKKQELLPREDRR